MNGILSDFLCCCQHHRLLPWRPQEKALGSIHGSQAVGTGDLPSWKGFCGLHLCFIFVALPKDVGSLLIMCGAAVARAAVMHVRITVCSGNFHCGSAVVQDAASPSS